MAKDHSDISKGINFLSNNFDLVILLILLIQSYGNEII